VTELQAAQTRNCCLIPGSGKRFFASQKASGWLCGLSNHPIQWVMGVLSLGAKVKLHIHSPVRLHGTHSDNFIVTHSLENNFVFNLNNRSHSLSI